MKYNPQIHHRRSIRLQGYDYSQAGAYFITICCQNRECRFGKIVGASLADAVEGNRTTEMVAPTMELNEYGTIACNEWNKLPERFLNFELDVFQIMPNHMHGIIVLNDSVGATLAVAQNIEPNVGTTVINNAVTDIRQPLELPLRKKRLVTSWVHTNHWFQMDVWKYLNQKMK